MTLGNRIKKARKSKKWTLQRLADGMGVTKQLVWQWEHDQSDARKHIEKLSQALEMPVEYFYAPAQQDDLLEAKIRRLNLANQDFLETMVDKLLTQQEAESVPPVKRA